MSKNLLFGDSFALENLHGIFFQEQSKLRLGMTPGRWSEAPNGQLMWPWKDHRCFEKDVCEGLGGSQLLFRQNHHVAAATIVAETNG